MEENDTYVQPYRGSVIDPKFWEKALFIVVVLIIGIVKFSNNASI